MEEGTMVASSSSEPGSTPASMNPLLLASSCFGSWRALSFLLDRDRAPGEREGAVPTQAFLDLLLDGTNVNGDATQQQAASHSSLEEGGGDLWSSLPAATSLLEGVTVEGNTALHAVAVGDGDDFLRCAGLVYRKARHLLVAQNKRGDTPLHCAARAGRSRMVSRLVALEDGGDRRLKELLRKENRCRETALHVSVRIGAKDIVELLMAADPELAIFPLDGTSPLYLAVLLEQVDIAQSLYDKSGGNLSYSGPNGQNALHAAALRSKVLTEMLLRWNMGLTTRGDQNGSTPLHFATSMLHPSRLHFWMYPRRKHSRSSMPFDLLLQANLAPMYQSDDKGLFPIHVAAAIGVKEVVMEILDKYPNTAGLRDVKGRTYLHVAVEKKKWDIVAHACQTPSLSWILNMQENGGNTALHLCIKFDDLDVFCLLLNNRQVLLNLANNRGETALDLSESKISLGPLSGALSSMNPRFFMDVALKFCHAKHGNRRLDHFKEECIKLDDEHKASEKLTTSTQTLGLGQVLIATVAFGATFTLPGGYQSDGTPTFSGRYVFDAFLLANSLAFGCSGLATINLMYSGIATIDVALRSRHFYLAVLLAASAVTSLAIAFVLGLYMVLATFARGTATVLCVLASLISLCGYIDPLRGHAVGRALHTRLGNQSLLIFGRVLFLRTLVAFWPMMVTFFGAAISTKFHNRK